MRPGARNTGTHARAQSMPYLRSDKFLKWNCTCWGSRRVEAPSDEKLE
jgi:hypothetical protein